MWNMDGWSNDILTITMIIIKCYQVLHGFFGIISASSISYLFNVKLLVYNIILLTQMYALDDLNCCYSIKNLI